MNPQNGTISNWNEEKGFGFITPKSGGKTLFAHINDYSRTHKDPYAGLEIEYFISTDQKGRKCAVDVRPLRGHKKPSPSSRQRILSIFLFCGFAIVLYTLFNSKLIPLELVGLYATLCVIAFIMYAKDKSAAEWGKWRTAESTLHILSLLGGWPGAALAQSFLRHKSKKLSFRVTYWITVFVNCGALYWLITPEGSLWLKNILKKTNMEVWQLNKIIKLLLPVCTILLLTSCYVPETFTSNIEISKNNDYKIDYNGILTHALAKAEFVQTGKFSKKTEDALEKEEKKLLKEKIIKKCKYIGNAQFNIYAQSEGKLIKSFRFLGGDSTFVTITPLPKNQIEVTGKKISNKEINELKSMGIKIDGTINLKTQGKVLKHNASSEPKFGGFLGAYTWKIKSPSDPAPYMLIQL